MVRDGAVSAIAINSTAARWAPLLMRTLKMSLYTQKWFADTTSAHRGEWGVCCGSQRQAGMWRDKWHYQNVPIRRQKCWKANESHACVTSDKLEKFAKLLRRRATRWPWRSWWGRPSPPWSGGWATGSSETRWIMPDSLNISNCHLN